LLEVYPMADSLPSFGGNSIFGRRHERSMSLR
jgi:hypothetical protein